MLSVRADGSGELTEIRKVDSGGTRNDNGVSIFTCSGAERIDGGVCGYAFPLLLL